MYTLLTPKLLLTHGFVELEEKDIVGRSIYRLSNIEGKYGSYGHDIQIVLNPQYPDSNPNSGIVSIHMPELTYTVVPDDLLDKDELTAEEEKRIDDNVHIAEAITYPVAWHVVTYERLKIIVESLTLTTLKYGK